MSEAYWAKIFFRDFLSHFIGMTKEEMGEDIAKSLKAVAKLDANGDCWGCEMVRSATERMNGQAAQAHKESGKLGGRPAKQIPLPKNMDEVLDYAHDEGLFDDDWVKWWATENFKNGKGRLPDGKKINNWKALLKKAFNTKDRR